MQLSEWPFPVYQGGKGPDAQSGLAALLGQVFREQ